MKKLALSLAVAALAIGTSALAQQPGPRTGQGAPGGGRQQGGMRMARMQQAIFAKLNLTADQKKKLDTLQKSTQAKVKALRDKNQGANRETLRPKMREIMQAHQQGVRNILTDEQERKLRELMQAEMKKMREQRGQGAPGGGPRRPANGA